MNDLERLLGQVLAGQDNLKEMLERHFEEDRELAKRVMAIEGKLNWAAGMTAGVLFIWVALSDFVLRKIGLKT